MIKGTDLAYCNINVNYQLMKESGMRFAIIKLGQGLLPKDPMSETHRIGCESVNIPWDWYWFCDYRYSGTLNVDQLISKANGTYGRRHVCQDLEFYDRFGPRPSGKNMLAFSLDFFSTLEARTQIVGTLYTNRDVLTQMWMFATDTQKEQLARHELWFASHTVNPAKTHLPIMMNQWDLDVVAPWAQGTVDYDEFLGTEEEFLAWSQGTPAPLTLEERVSRLERLVEEHGYG